MIVVVISGWKSLIIIITKIKLQPIKSLDEPPIHYEDNDVSDLGSLIESPNITPDDHLYKKELYKAVKECSKSLSERDFSIYRDKILNEMSIEKLKTKYSLSKNSPRNIEKKCNELLRKCLEKRGITLEYLNDDKQSNIQYF